MKIINLLLISFFILAFYYMSKTVKILFFLDQRNTVENYFFFLVLLILIITIIFVYFKENEFKIKFTISLISIFIGLIFIEKILYFYNLKLENPNKKFLYYKSKLLEDQTYFVSIQPNNINYKKFNLQPLASKASVKTIHCNENGYFSEYKSDRFGFNNDDAIWEKDEIDYLLIGDSYVHGACVMPMHNLSGQIMNSTNKKVLNLGYSSNGPLMEFASLKEYGLKKKIKNLIWVFYEGNDIYDLQIELNNNILINYLQNENFSQNLTEKQNIIDKIFENRLNYEVNYFSKKYNLYSTNFPYVRRIFKQFFNNKQIEDNTYFYFNKLISELSILCRKNNINLVFVYLQNFNQKQKRDLRVFEILNKNKIKYIDIKKNMKDKNIKDILPLKRPGHFNEKGYKFISNIILSNLN